MKAKILDGKSAADALRLTLKEKISKLPRSPTLSIIYVGNDQASAIYTKNKIKASDEVGIKATLHHFDFITCNKLIKFIQEDLKNEDGVIIQLPVPENLNKEELVQAIRPEQDVDGLHYVNIGRRLTGDSDAFWPCTPVGCIELLDKYNIRIDGLHAVVIGRSNLVGRPLANLLEMRNATVTICHSKSSPLARYTRDADLLIAATGKAKFVKAFMIKEDAIILDVGINRDENGKLCGDVDFNDVKEKCSYISPVPGGIGPMTVAGLLANTVKSAEKKLASMAPLVDVN